MNALRRPVWLFLVSTAILIPNLGAGCQFCPQSGGSFSILPADAQCPQTPCTDSDGDRVCDNEDGCPNDPDKTSPGECGCGEPEVLDCGITPPLEVNRAARSNGGTATAISEGCYLGICHPASLANDGDYETDWTSQWSMPAWIEVEFDQVYLIRRVAVEVSYHQQKYTASLSADGSHWTPVVDDHVSSNVPASIPTNESAGPAYEVFDIAPMEAKFIKVDITHTSAPSSHIFQAVVSEIEAYSY